MLRFTNTLSGAVEPFAPADGQTVRMYTCGPTVYDYAHIGNLRTYVFEDVLRRRLRSKGWKLVHVMNITDIDDKIIRRAMEQGVDIRAITAPYTEAFFEDCAALRIERPDVITPATDYIPEMIELVERLLASGHAYREGDSIYFRISRFPTYGRLSRLDRRELKVGARIDADEYDKEQPNDFVLWKAPKDPREPRWDTPFGEGRPGWHLECSAMAMKNLGSTLDIHCGGVDNIFPHHENEIAQSESATGQPFARFWIHGEHLLVEGEKMAKSKGNFYTLRNLLERGKNPLAIRYLLLSTHYRKQLNFTMEGLAQAASALDRIAEFIFRMKAGNLPEGAGGLEGAVKAAGENFEAGLDDDLNTPRALGVLFELIREGNAALDAGKMSAGDRERILEWLKVVDDRLAIIPQGTGREPSSDSDTAEIERLVAERAEARRNRDFARSDRIRQELADRGILIEDTRDGMRWRRK
ncbi:MAG TPA: cysteine--tRNA ligase [Terriglobia bacterium]|nr:cysteine--tRNA ligase [Terriglobia bacterium]